MLTRNLLSFAAALLVITPAVAQSTHSVRGYTRKDGTYVAPHLQTNPNNTRNDNWSTRGNTNPSTGEAGSKPRDGEGASTETYRPKPSTYGTGY